MNYAQKIEVWSDKHHFLLLDLGRMLLGTIIFLKGLQFVSDISVLDSLIRNSKLEFVSFLAAHYVACAHLVGGILISIGLITRVAIVFQIPILIGAVFFINPLSGFQNLNSELSFAILILLGLLFYLVYGSGHHSADRWMETHTEK